MKSIPLRNRAGDIIAEAIVDDEDYTSLSQHRWSLLKIGYAAAHITKDGTRSLVTMHRIVNRTPAGKMTDHINGDRIDNRKSNLRTCTASENMMNKCLQKNNTSGFRGVCWFKPARLWFARIKVGGRQICLGYFKSKAEAVAARTKAEPKYHGDFAYSARSAPTGDLAHAHARD